MNSFDSINFSQSTNFCICILYTINFIILSFHQNMNMMSESCIDTHTHARTHARTHAHTHTHTILHEHDVRVLHRHTHKIFQTNTCILKLYCLLIVLFNWWLINLFKYNLISCCPIDTHSCTALGCRVNSRRKPAIIGSNTMRHQKKHNIGS